MKGFLLGPGDEISVSVYRNSDLNVTELINPSGRLSFPLVGHVQVVGMDVVELQERLTDKLSRYLVDPQVRVTVTSVYSRKAFILGEVARPGVFQVIGPTSALDAISLAGGFTLDAKQDNVLLIRGGLSHPQLLTLNIEKFLKKGEGLQNLYLQKGDIVYVPASHIANVERFFRRIHSMLVPIVLLETGIILEPLVEDAFRGKSSRPTTLQPLIVPPR